MSTLLVEVIFAEGLCYPMALGAISSIGGVVHKVYFSSSVNSQERFDWVLLGTSENFT